MDRFLITLAEGDDQAILRARIARRSHAGIDLAQLTAENRVDRQVIETTLASVALRTEVSRIEDLAVHLPALED